jgi:hypothetical protein
MSLLGPWERAQEAMDLINSFWVHVRTEKHRLPLPYYKIVDSKAFFAVILSRFLAAALHVHYAVSSHATEI